MAKSKTENIEIIDVAEKNNAIKKKLEKDFGDVFLSPEFILNKKRLLIPVSPKLDIALNGGIPSGCCGIISGKSKSGKSSLALTILANAQKQGMRGYYLDVEHRLERKNLEGIPGLDLSEDKLQIITSTKGNILTAEKNLTIAETLLKNEEKIIMIIDSTSSLCSLKEYDAEMCAQTRNEGAKLLSQFTRKLSQIVPVQDSIVILIQHLIHNTSGYGPLLMEDGGVKIIYASDFKLRSKGFSKWEEDNRIIGQVINWEIAYSALGQPGANVEGYLRYGCGIDCIRESLEIGIDLGLINKSGAWYNTDYSKNPQKFQGLNNLWKHLNENIEDIKLLNQLIKENFQ